MRSAALAWLAAYASASNSWRRADVRRRELERLVERRLLVHPPENAEEEEREAEAHREEPWNVAAREMAELVREHRLDLGRREPLHERVEEDDALVGAEAGEIRVAVSRAARAVHDEEPLGVEAAAFQQRLDPPPELSLLERRETVEERSDPAREHHHQHERERDPHDPGIEPPQRARGLDQPENAEEERGAERDRKRRPLDDVERED